MLAECVLLILFFTIRVLQLLALEDNSYLVWWDVFVFGDLLHELVNSGAAVDFYIE